VPFHWFASRSRRRRGKASPIYPSSAERSSGWVCRGAVRKRAMPRTSGAGLSRPRRTVELRAIFDGLYELAGNPTKPVTADDIVQTRRHVRELTKIGEREIHEVVLSRARPAPIIELRANYELAKAALCPMVFRPASGCGGCVSCVSDQYVGTVRDYHSL